MLARHCTLLDEWNESKDHLAGKQQVKGVLDLWCCLGCPGTISVSVAVIDISNWIESQILRACVLVLWLTTTSPDKAATHVSRTEQVGVTLLKGDRSKECFGSGTGMVALHHPPVQVTDSEC